MIEINKQDYELAISEANHSQLLTTFEKLKEENLALKAQVELLQSRLIEIKYRNPEIEMPVFMRTGQCLAEIKAQAVEAEYRDLLHVVANQYDGNDSSEWSIGANHVFRLFAKEVTKRTNQLRQQVKGEL